MLCVGHRPTVDVKVTLLQLRHAACALYDQLCSTLHVCKWCPFSYSLLGVSLFVIVIIALSIDTVLSSSIIVILIVVVVVVVVVVVILVSPTFPFWCSGDFTGMLFHSLLDKPKSTWLLFSCPRFSPFSTAFSTGYILLYWAVPFCR